MQVVAHGSYKTCVPSTTRCEWRCGWDLHIQRHNLHIRLFCIWPFPHADTAHGSSPKRGKKGLPFFQLKIPGFDRIALNRPTDIDSTTNHPPIILLQKRLPTWSPRIALSLPVQQQLVRWHLLKQDNRPLWGAEIRFSGPENSPFPPPLSLLNVIQPYRNILLDDAGSRAGGGKLVYRRVSACTNHLGTTRAKP